MGPGAIIARKCARVCACIARRTGKSVPDLPCVACATRSRLPSILDVSCPPACLLAHAPVAPLLQSRTEGGAARRSRLRRCTSRPSTCSALCTLSRASRWARRGDDQLMVLERGAAARLSPRPPPHVCVAAAVRGAVLPHLCATVDGSSRSCGRCLPGAGSTLSSSSLRRRPGVLSDYCVSTACCCCPTSAPGERADGGAAAAVPVG